MSAFDRIIGYDHIKNEMLEIMDILKNPEIYRAPRLRQPTTPALSRRQGTCAML